MVEHTQPIYIIPGLPPGYLTHTIWLYTLVYVKIAHHSGAGQYIDGVDRDLDTTLVLANDRSSSVGRGYN